jgi:hypothetical protein
MCHLSQFEQQFVVFWSKENPHFLQEPVHAALAMTSDYLLGLYFYNDA